MLADEPETVDDKRRVALKGLLDEHLSDVPRDTAAEQELARKMDETRDSITLEEAERMKQAWRDEDERAVRSGEKTAEEVNRANSWVHLSGEQIDYAASTSDWW